ncbi:MAG TPA: hypothetical protein VGI16_12050 [Candidatus Acidoferrum sp.]|jgi:hypothetical protein
MPSLLRPILSLVLVATFAVSPAFAFTAPLSEEAVREAYFLGQRRDESLVRALDKYTKHLPAPKIGPNIASVTFLTPFALVAQLSSQNVFDYSAQKAQLDYRSHPDTVKIVVQILLTDSYGQLIVSPSTSRSNPATGFTQRSYGFWKDFQVQVFDKDKLLTPSTFYGEPNYFCDGNACTLTGATLELEFPASDFSANSATIQIDPPEGDQVIAEIDHSTLR